MSTMPIKEAPAYTLDGLAPNRIWILGILLALVTLGSLISFQRYAEQRATVVAQAQSRALMRTQRAAAPVQPQAAPIDSIRAAIERANRAFIEARNTGNPAPLQAAGTGAWLAGEQQYLAGMRTQGQTERWRLINIEFVTIDQQNGIVCTRERWERTPIDSRGRPGPATTMSFTENYTLVRQGNDWRVSTITFE